MNIAINVLRWFVFLLPDLFMSLAAYIVVPVAVAFREGNRLPEWAAWFETEDNDIYGDEGHLSRWKAKGEYLCAVAWLLRNRAYYFSKHIAGAPDASLNVRVYGSPNIGNRPYIPGAVLRVTEDGFWQLYVIAGWGKDRLLRLNLGWKLWGDPEHPNFGQFVFALNPWAKRG